MTAIIFKDDDSGYLHWLAENPKGYVVNMRVRLDPDYLILHCATCPSINRYPDMKVFPGGFTERSYRKFCSTSLPELSDTLGEMTGKEDPFSEVCGLCKPE